MTLAQLTKWVEQLWSEGLGPEDGVYIGRELDNIIGGAILRHQHQPDIRIAVLITDEEDMLRASIEADTIKPPI